MESEAGRLMATIPPGPRGELLGQLNYSAWQADMFGFLKGLAETYGDVIGFDLGRSPCILVNGAPQVRELFLEREACLRKPKFVKDSNRGYWGDGLTTLEGAAWRERRRILRPSFTTRAVAARLPVVAQCTEDMLDAWAHDSAPDLLREFRLLTARIAVRVVLDAEVEGFGGAAGRSGIIPLLEAYGEDYVSSPGGDPTAPLVMVRPRAPRRMDAVVRLIDERIGSGEERGDVLSDLVKARLPDGGSLDRDAIVGEIIQMLYAGHLTIPATLLHFWRDIADSEVAATIASEADLSWASDSLDLSGSYCLAALKESMRVHPPAPILYREVETAFELSGFEFSRDVAVWVCPQLLHRDARYFPEPDRFIPDRFMGGRPAGVMESVYLPFGAGPRTCIGNNQALHQITLISLRIARRFGLSPAPDHSTRFLVRARRSDCSP